MNDEKIYKFCEMTLYHSQMFENFCAKFSYVSMRHYECESSIVNEQRKEITCEFEGDTFYIIDVMRPQQYIDYLIGKGIFPIPIFHHHWHPKGAVGDSEMYNKLISDSYLGLEKASFDKRAFLFDGNRHNHQELNVNTYDNRWEIDEEMIPNKMYLEHNGYNKVKIICDQKRNDLFSTCSYLYDDKYEFEVISNV